MNHSADANVKRQVYTSTRWEFTRVHEFPVEGEVVEFIMWTSRGHQGLFLIFLERLFLDAPAPGEGGDSRRPRPASAEALCVLFTRFSGVSGRNEFTPRSGEQAIKKKEEDTKTIYRSPSANNGGVCLFVCNTCNTEDVLEIAWLDQSLLLLSKALIPKPWVTMRPSVLL